jgi:hypothetical protein
LLLLWEMRVIQGRVCGRNRDIAGRDDRLRIRGVR